MNAKVSWLKVTPALVMLLFAARFVNAGSLDEKVIELFPKNVSEFAYANLDEARQLPWFAQFQEQVVPATVITFEQFLSSSGINASLQIDEVAWATASNGDGSRADSGAEAQNGGVFGVMLGQFDADSAQSALKAKRLTTVELDGYTLYACAIGPECGDMFIFFVDSNTVAFGRFALLKRLIDVKNETAESLLENQLITSLIDGVNGDATFWAVFDSNGARQAIQRLAPEASNFTHSTNLFSNLKSLAVSVQSSTDTELHLQIACSSPSDSLFLSQVLQAALLFREYQASPVLAQTLEEATVAPNGNLVDVSIEMSNDQLIGLIEENAFGA